MPGNASGQATLLAVWRNWPLSDEEIFMRLDATAQGVYPIAPTPFHPDGRIDEGSIDRLAEAYIASGATGLTVLGIMGEAPKLEPEEALNIAARFIGGMPRLPVIVGVSAPGFAAMRSLARAAMDRGAAGVMIAPVPSLRTDDQITAYYRQAVEAIGLDIPFVIQDYPLTLSVQMTPKVIRQIVEENPSCVMLKHEDWPGLEKISALRGFQAEGSMRPISILTGNGGLFLDFEMERGADGAMTGYAFPEMLVDVVRLQKAGRREEAHDIFDAHLPLLRYEQQQGVGLAVRKYTMMKRGLLTSDAQRKPGSVLSAAARVEVDYLLGRLAKFDRRAAGI
jgi:4-hydroxy-tetrahydrodipicolinate synthase